MLYRLTLHRPNGNESATPFEAPDDPEAIRRARAHVREGKARGLLPDFTHFLVEARGAGPGDVRTLFDSRVEGE